MLSSYRRIFQRYDERVLFPKFNLGNILICLRLQLHASAAQSFFHTGTLILILHVRRNTYLRKKKTNQRGSRYRTEITPVLPIAGHIPCDMWRDTGIVTGILKFLCIDYRISREILIGKQSHRPSKPG